MNSSTNLHSGLYDIEGSVSEHTGGTSNSSKHTSYQRVNGLVGVIALVIEKKQNKREQKVNFWAAGLSRVWPLFIISSQTNLCTSSSVKSSHRSGWLGWSPVLTRWLSGLDKSPSVLKIHQYNQ